MAEDLEVLPELVVEDSPPPHEMPPPISGGSAYGYQQNIENEMSWPTWYIGSDNQVHSPDEAFAPPLPEVLPEVVVTPRPAPPAPRVVVPPPAIAAALPLVPIAAIVAEAINWGMEQFRRPNLADERPVYVPPVELEVLPELKVEATRPPAPPSTRRPTATPGDPWPFNLDPLEWYPDAPGQRPFFPDFGDRPSVDEPGTVRVPGTGPAPLELEPRTAPTPGTRPGVGAPELRPAPDPLELPFGLPGGSPLDSPDVWFAPEIQPRIPSLDPLEQPLPAPVKTPTPGGFDVPWPGLPGYDLLPGTDLVSAPAPGENRRPEAVLDPFADPLRAQPTADPCSCAKAKKPKKKREPRSVCYRGTYTETSKSLRKVRGERIPCS